MCSIIACLLAGWLACCCPHRTTRHFLQQHRWVFFSGAWRRKCASDSLQVHKSSSSSVLPQLVPTYCRSQQYRELPVLMQCKFWTSAFARAN